MKLIKIILAILLVILVAYFLGPNPKTPDYSTTLPSIPDQPDALESYLRQREASIPNIKPDNEARIIWYQDSMRSKTDYSLVYLHGFSASHEEGNPIHQQLAKRFGMNLFLSRLADHGRSKPDALSEFTAQTAWEDAKEAYAIGKAIGHQVILLSTSTGGTLSLKLAAEFPEIKAQILFSPNIKINDPSAFLLNNPWGLQIARQVIGSDYRLAGDTTTLYSKYWDAKYRIEALVELEELVETTMVPATFRNVKQPTLLLYYYKNEAEQDPVVSVEAMKEMFDLLGTPGPLKSGVALPYVGNHVIGSYIKSQDLKSVLEITSLFIENKLGIKPMPNE
jgi:pimeloyl-ACP methyl ester carboxylesterase